MSEATNPLLELVHEQGMLDDLQYEEVLSEHKRSGEPVYQILQNFGILDADSILQTMANHLATEVVSLKQVHFTPELLAVIPANQARALECIPVELNGSSVKVAADRGGGSE